MKEFSELFVKRRLMQRKSTERAKEIETLQKEYDGCTSPKLKRTLFQQIDELKMKPLDL